MSSFIGSGLERATTDLPIELDSDLGEWVKVGRVDTQDGNIALSFGSFALDLSAGKEVIEVWVSVSE